MEIVRGEIDQRQLDAILTRWNALARRDTYQVLTEGRSIIQQLCDDMTILLVAFGCEVTKKP